MANDPRLTCQQCRYLFVTHDRNKPWGCHIFGFKSPYLPGQVVATTSGTKCANYSRRNTSRMSETQEKPKGIWA